VPYEQLEHAVEIPRAGVTARRWRRFETELAAWLDTAEGRFAQFHAQRAIGEVGQAAARQSAHSPRTMT
jgi:hypothetical protein